MKKYFIAVDGYTANPTSEQKQEILTQMSVTYSKIDKAVKRGVFHPNNGASVVHTAITSTADDVPYCSVCVSGPVCAVCSQRREFAC